MIRDAASVTWKEWRELTAAEGWESGLLGLILFVGLLGLFLPYQVGRSWLSAPWVMLFWIWVPIFLMTTVTADTFAGERERGTLGSLLATRLPDRAILAGKIAAAVTYVWGATLLSVPLSLIAINFKASPGPLAYYTAGQLGTVATLALLSSIFGAALGVLISLRSPTVRHAQQTFSLGVLVAFVFPVFGLQMLPAATKTGLIQALVFGEAGRVALVLAVVFTVLDVLLVTAAMARFRRGRLLLN
ncbi:MAG: ABC transporter permease [Gemmatimonadales bacterium]